MSEPRGEHREAGALLAAAAERARAGAGGVVLLRGATGTGRTTALEAAARDAAAHGMRVLHARCSPGDTTVPFAVVRQLLGDEGGVEHAEGERAQADALSQVLRAYADQAPLFVAVDDVHLADAPSHRWLVECARHLGRLSLPVLLAVTERSQYDVDPPAPGFTHTLSPALVHTHTLAPLTGPAATALVQAEFPGAPVSWTADCVRAGAGSPLLLRALLGDLGSPERHPEVPETTGALYPGAYPAAVSWWLDSAGPGTAEVARALAALEEGWDDLTPGTSRPTSAYAHGEPHWPETSRPGPENGQWSASSAYAHEEPPRSGGPGFDHEPPQWSPASAYAHQEPPRSTRSAHGHGAPQRSATSARADEDPPRSGRSAHGHEPPQRSATSARADEEPPRSTRSAHGHEPPQRSATSARADEEPPRSGRSAHGHEAPQRSATSACADEEPPRSGRSAHGYGDHRWSAASAYPRDEPPQSPRSAHAPDEPRPASAPERSRWSAASASQEPYRSTASASARQEPYRSAASAPEWSRWSAASAYAGREPYRAAVSAYAGREPHRFGAPVYGSGVAQRSGSARQFDAAVSAERLAGLLAELAGADPARVAGWLTAMTGLGLLRPGPGGRPRYAHPLLRDAVLTGVPAARRRAAHRAAAEAMLHRGAGTETVARQLLLADPVDAPWAPAVLQDAARSALRDGRADDAVAYLHRALDEPLPDPVRQRLLTELGSLECAGSESSAGIPRLTAALHLGGTPQDQVRAAVALGTALTARGRARAAVEVLCAVNGRLDGHPELTGTLQAASALLSDHDQTVRREVYRRLSETAERSPERVVPAARALLVRHAATAGLTSAAQAMKEIRELLAEPADALTEPFLLGTAAAIAQWADELDEAERLVDRGLAGQRPELLHPMHAALLHTRADIAAARGEYALLPAEPPVSPDTGPSNAHGHILIALVETGRAAEARRLADGFDLRDAPDSWELNRFLYARGMQRLTAGDPAAALHDFLECGRRQTAREVVSPVVTPWRTAAAECRLALGDHREALALAEEELELARVWGTPRTVGRALRVLGTVTGGRRGLELAEESVRLLRDEPVVAEAELVAALIAQGRQLTAAGEAARARLGLRQAAERAERLGALRLLALAEEALREGGARRTAAARTGSGALTDSERRVARLAADGRTNSEIAALLHLARRTVETHLTSTYKKLGIRRRSELGRALGAD
ncbi:helix-turn-helix transcriptional regulator [Streptomyces sp. 7R007]